MKLARLLLPVAVIALSPHLAHAQAAQAEVLFKEGKTLIKQGSLAQGCDKLTASEAAESSVGTLLNLGDCREKLGQLATAWAAFVKAEATARRDGGDEKRRAEAERRAAALEPKVLHFTIRIAAPPHGTAVTLNGKPVDAAAWNTPLPIDPGNYDIVVTAPGFAAYKTNIDLPANARQREVNVPALVAAPDETSVAAVSAPPPPIVVTRHHTWSTARGFAVAAAVAGAAGIGVGIGLGLHADDLRDQSDALCPLPVCADAEGLRLNDAAQRSATRANIAYAAGGGLLLASAILWVAGRPHDETIIAPSVGAGSIGATVAGRF